LVSDGLNGSLAARSDRVLDLLRRGDLDLATTDAALQLWRCRHLIGAPRRDGDAFNAVATA
jgi:hypothetical protein